MDANQLSEHTVKHFRITRFLLDMNKLMDGVHIQETTEDHRSTLIKFEATLTCPFASPFMWSPSAAFYNILSKCLKKWFDIDDYNSLGWNNTNTVFWFEKSRIPMSTEGEMNIHEIG